MDRSPASNLLQPFDESMSTFRSFQDPALAEALAEALHKAGIPVRIVDGSSPVAPLIIGSGSDDFIQVLLYPADFARAGVLLDELVRGAKLEIPGDYYLYSFSVAELEEVIDKPDEWNALDIRLAQQLLEKQGHAIGDEELQERKRLRISELREPEHISAFWKVLGIFFTLLISPVTLFTGLGIALYRKTLPDGSRFYAYTESSRRFGKMMAIVSLLLIVLRLAFRIYFDLFFFGWSIL